MFGTQQPYTMKYQHFTRFFFVKSLHRNFRTLCDEMKFHTLTKTELSLYSRSSCCLLFLLKCCFRLCRGIHEIQLISVVTWWNTHPNNSQKIKAAVCYFSHIVWEKEKSSTLLWTPQTTPALLLHFPPLMYEHSWKWHLLYIFST